MNNTKKTIEEILEETKPRALLEHERASLWSGFSEKVAKAQSVHSPYTIFVQHTKAFAVGTLALVLLLGGTGTVFASENARPGDILFPVGKAIEDTRVALTPKAERVALRLHFAEKRAKQIETLLEEEHISSSDTTESGELSERAQKRIERAVNAMNIYMDTVHTEASTTIDADEVIKNIEDRMESNSGKFPLRLREKVQERRERILERVQERARERKTEAEDIESRHGSEDEIEVEIEHGIEVEHGTEIEIESHRGGGE